MNCAKGQSIFVNFLRSCFCKTASIVKSLFTYRNAVSHSTYLSVGASYVYFLQAVLYTNIILQQLNCKYSQRCTTNFSCLYFLLYATCMNASITSHFMCLNIPREHEINPVTAPLLQQGIFIFMHHLLLLCSARALSFFLRILLGFMRGSHFLWSIFVRIYLSSNAALKIE